MTEDYVSFKVAKLLRKKGMDNTCFTHYIQHNNSDGTSEAVAVCTLQMAMKWLRKVYWLNIFPQFDRWNENWSVIIKSMDDRNIIHNNTALKMNGFDSYESSVDAAIQYCLTNLI